MIQWTSEDGRYSGGLAIYSEAEINGHRCTIIERPAIGYCRWYGSTNTEIIEDQPAASFSEACSAAEEWANNH